MDNKYRGGGKSVGLGTVLVSGLHRRRGKSLKRERNSVAGFCITPGQRETGLNVLCRGGGDDKESATKKPRQSSLDNGRDVAPA